MSHLMSLNLNSIKKNRIFPVLKGVAYLGWRFYLTETGKVIRRLRTSNKRRFKRRLKSFARKYYNGEKDLEDIKQSIAGYSGHLSHGHTWKLQCKVYGGFKLVRNPNLPQPEIADEFWQ